MSDLDAYIRDIEEHCIPPLRSRLAPLVAGKMRVHQGPEDDPAADVTQREIDLLQQAIAEYEAIVADYRRTGHV